MTRDRDSQCSPILKFCVRSSCLVDHSPPNPWAQMLQIFFQGDLRYDLQAKRLELQVPEARPGLTSLWKVEQKIALKTYNQMINDQTTNLSFNVGLVREIFQKLELLKFWKKTHRKMKHLGKLLDVSILVGRLTLWMDRTPVKLGCHPTVLHAMP